MSWLRLCVRITAFMAFLAATTMLAAGLRVSEVVTRKAIDRTPWARFCFRWACRCLGLRIHQHGSPSDDTVLFVSNHISWSDIPVLGSLAPMRFLSKAEVGHWPVIGWLATTGRHAVHPARRRSGPPGSGPDYCEPCRLKGIGPGLPGRHHQRRSDRIAVPWPVAQGRSREQNAGTADHHCLSPGRPTRPSGSLH